MLTNPDPPRSLKNNAAVTSPASLGMTWEEPLVHGGTPVIDYRVSWDQGGLAYVVLQAGIVEPSYITTARLTAGTTYKFKVEARNAYGFSSFSDVLSIKAAITTAPTAP